MDNHAAVAFEEALARAALRTEIRRTTVMVVLLLVTSAILGVFFTLQSDDFARVASDSERRYLAVPVVLSLALYELLRRRRLQQILDSGGTWPMWRRYGNAAIEISIPSFVMMVLASFLHPVEVLASPPSYTYPLFIIMGTLQLDFRLCLFMGAAAALQSLGAFFYFQDAVLASQFGDTFFAVTAPYLVRAGGFALCGLVAGLLAMEIRNRLVESVSAAIERERVLDVFGQQVSPEVVDTLLERDADEQAAKTRHVCVVFLDIRGFTRFSAERSPEEVVQFLEGFFEPLVEVVNRHGGIINKFLGDGFMAVWGAPLQVEHPEAQAVAACRELLAEVERLSSAGEFARPRIGLGVHAGAAVTGSVGSTRRKEYTVIGDTVNLAARVEQLNKRYDSQCLVTRAVLDALPESTPESTTGFEPLGVVEVRGRDAGIQLYRMA